MFKLSIKFFNRRSSNLHPEGYNELALWFYKISIFYYGLLAIVVAILVAVLLSLLTGRLKNLKLRNCQNLNIFLSQLVVTFIIFYKNKDVPKKQTNDYS